MTMLGNVASATKTKTSPFVNLLGYTKPFQVGMCTITEPQSGDGYVAYDMYKDISSGFQLGLQWTLYRGVSTNGDTPKWMVYNGKTY